MNHPEYHMHANQAHPMYSSGATVDTRMNAVSPHRTEVDRLNGVIDRLEKAILEHIDRIEPVLRPSMPGPPEAARLMTGPDSRLASLVSRLEEVCERLGRVTERVEA